MRGLGLRARSILVGAVLAGTFAAPAASNAATKDFAWDERPLELSVLAGTATETSIGFTWTEAANATAPRIVITGPAGDVLFADLAGTSSDGDNHYSVPVQVEVPASATGSLNGSLLLKDGNANVGPALPVHLTVETPDAQTIPDEPADPSSERIATTALGLAVAIDEIVVGVSFDIADPVQVATDVAVAGGGVFIGSVPSLRLYQLQFPGSQFVDLAEQIAAAEGAPGVEFASYNYVDQDIDTVVPDDTEWDSWDVDAPAGNNWGLEWIDAPGAWDTTTGSSSIRIAVIDLGNDHNHGDLDDNVSRSERNGDGSHGTHVAGTICAEGNNGRGVTGVSWDCDLRFFGAGNSAAVTAGRMADAVDDGARIVNMSLNYIENGNCTIDEALLADDAGAANDLFGQAVIYGQRVGADVLWVIAAGNDCGRDALYTAPGGLGARFPTNAMTVAAIGRDGSLAAFSNDGDIVSVAAPGVEIYSTVPRTGCILGLFSCDDNYGFKNGTSMAAPHVAGLAGLVLADDPSRTAAEVKSCIVAGAQRAGTEVPGQDFRTINARAAVECGGVIDLPAEVDIVLALDLTGSMGGVLAQAKSEITEVVDTLATVAPSTDFRFAVVSYEDYPGFYSSTACGSTYSATYGSSSDEPFRLNAPLSDDTGTIAATVNGLSLGSGADGPESYGRVLWEIAQEDTGDSLGWRPDALRLIINFGDNVPHDVNLNDGVDGGTLADDTGVDPGRNGVIDCGGDDIDFQDDAIAELTASGGRLLFVDSSSGSSIEPYWRTWTSLTGGAYAKLGTSTSLSEVIVELLALL